MSIELILAFEGASASNKRECVRIRPDVPISQCISELLERKHRNFPRKNSSDESVEYGIFAVGPKMAWLSPRQPVSSYDISDQTQLELRCIRSAQKVLFDDGKHIVLNIDRSKKVAELIMDIASKLDIAHAAHSFGLRYPDSALATATAGGEFSGTLTTSSASTGQQNNWLLNEFTLDAQGLTAGDAILFCKRFFDLDPTGYAASDVELGFAYLEARREFLSGKYDSVLGSDLAVELSVPLLLAQVGVQYTTPVNVLVDTHCASVLPPKYHKKAKRKGLTSKLTEVYRRLSASLWVLDAKNLKSYFLQTMLNVPGFGMSTFEAESVKFSTSISASLDSASIEVCSRFLAIETNKKHHHFLSLFEWAQVESKPRARAVIPLDAIVGASMDQGVVTVSVVSPFGFPIEINIVSHDGIQLGETINGVIAVQESHQTEPELEFSARKSDKSSPRNSSTMPKSSPRSSMARLSGNWRSRTLSDTLQAAQDSIKLSQNELEDVILLKHGAKNYDPTLADSQNTQWDSAAHELHALQTGLAAIQAKVQSGEFFNEYSQRSIDAVTNWATSASNLVKCIVLSSHAAQLPQRLQTVADTTFHVLELCLKVLGTLGAISSYSDARGKNNLSVSIEMLIQGCAALDLAFQGNLCDGITATSLYVCCHDIKSSIDSIAASATPLGAAKESSAELDNAKFYLQCGVQALYVFSSIYYNGDNYVSGTMHTIIDGVRNAANALVGAAMTRNPSIESNEAHADRTARLRCFWGCLDHSLHSFSELVKVAEPPMLTIDNRLSSLSRIILEALDTVAQQKLDSSVLRKFARGRITDVVNGLQRTFSTICDRASESLTVNLIECVDSTQRELGDSEAATFGTLNAPSAVLKVLPLFVESLNYIRNPAANLASALKQDLKILITAGVVYRSALLLCGTDIRNTAEQAQFIRQAQEQLDVLIREVLPPFVQAIAGLSSSSVNINSPGLQGFDAVMTESIRHMKLIFSALEADAAKLGTLGYCVFGIKKPMALFKGACVANIDLAFNKPKKSLIRDISTLSVRRQSTRRLQMMRTSSSIFARVHPLSEVKVEPESNTLEMLNETIFLQHVERLMLHGQAKYTELTNFKEAMEVYVTTFPYWTSADNFMAQIVPLLVNPDSSKKIDIDTHVVSTLCRLMRLHPRLVEDSACRILVNRAISFLSSSTPTFPDGARALEDTVASSLEMITRFNRIVLQQATTATPPSEVQKIDLMTVDLRLLAEQITVVEQKFFQAVSVADLLNHNYDRQTNSLSLWIQHTNALGRWFASRILQQQKPKQRAKLILRIFKLADLLGELRNYSVVITIYATLSGAAISNLHKTWDSIKELRSKLHELGESIQPLRNFHAYREEIKSLDAPCIPYMAVLTRDLICLEEVMSATMCESPRALQRSSSSSSSGLLNIQRRSTDSSRSRDSMESNASQETSFLSQSFQLFANIKHMVTVSKIVNSQFTRFRRVEYQLTADPVFFPELFSPALYEVFEGEDMQTVSNSLEPSKRASVGPGYRSLPLPRKQSFRRSHDSRYDPIPEDE